MSRVIGGAFIFWIWQDEEIEDRNLMKSQLEDINSHGFKGTLGMLRANRYQVDDPKVTDAVAFATKISRKKGMKFWFLADPRHAARHLIEHTGNRTQVLIVTREANRQLNDKNVNICKVIDGKYFIRIEYPNIRITHMTPDVSLHFDPVALEKVFSFNMENNIIISDSVQDITKDARFFVNYAANYVEVFGEAENGKYIVAFPKFNTNCYDFADLKSNQEFNHLLKKYKTKKIKPDGLLWDEPGYTPFFGRFPVSNSIYNMFNKKYGYDLRDKLYALILNVDDSFYLKVRYDYYTLLMDAVFGAQRRFQQLSRKLFGSIEMGIHHTCHLEGGGTQDMVHGSLDVWRGLEAVSSGFTDIGWSEKRATGDRMYEIISMMVMAKSLARFSLTKTAYINLWGVNFGDEYKEYPSSLMDYWVDLMGVFSNKWTAHAYGTTNVIGHDMRWGPGYPHHSTWPKFKKLNERIKRIEDFTKLRLPEANIAVIFPTETFMAIGNTSANELLIDIYKLIHLLTAENFQVDIISSTFFSQGKYKDGLFEIKGYPYEAIIFPYPTVVTKDILKSMKLLKRECFPLLLTGSIPENSINGKRVKEKFNPDFNLTNVTVEQLTTMGIKRLFEAPKGSFATLRRDGKDIIFAVCPNKAGIETKGKIKYGDIEFDIEKSSHIALYKISRYGKIIDRLRGIKNGK